MAALIWGWNSQQQLVRVKEEQRQALIVAEEKVKISNRALQIQHELVLEAKNDKIQRLNAHTERLLTSLRERPVRPDPTIYTEAGGSCTGRELYREDGEFLTREAARAERILEERNYYFAQYEALRKQLNAN